MHGLGGMDMLCRFSEIRCKEVINLCNGARLGYASDLELDGESGRVLSLLVPCPGRIFGLFGRSGDYVIPWPRIQKIGGDLILVDVNPEECRRPKEKHRRFQ